MKWLLRVLFGVQPYLPAPSQACSRNSTRCIGAGSGR